MRFYRKVKIVAVVLDVFCEIHRCFEIIRFISGGFDGKTAVFVGNNILFDVIFCSVGLFAYPSVYGRIGVRFFVGIGRIVDYFVIFCRARLVFRTFFLFCFLVFVQKVETTISVVSRRAE